MPLTVVLMRAPLALPLATLHSPLTHTHHPQVFALLGRRFVSISLVDVHGLNDHALASILRAQCPRLKHLGIQRCFSLTHSARALVDGPALRSLRTLSISDMTVDPLLLVQAAGGALSLESLSLTNCVLDANGRRDWVLRMVAGMPRLRSLFLGGSTIKNPPLAEVADDNAAENNAEENNAGAAVAAGGDGGDADANVADIDANIGGAYNAVDEDGAAPLSPLTLRFVESTYWSDEDVDTYLSCLNGVTWSTRRGRLVERAERVERVDRAGRTLLYRFLGPGDDALLQMNEHTLNPNTPCTWRQSSSELLDELMGTPATLLAALNCRNRPLRTPLHAACIAGAKDAVTWLLARGARVDLKDCKGCTPLFRK